MLFEDKQNIERETMSNKAFILGNGPDRPTGEEWLNSLDGDTYGCNAIYRDLEPDFIVANDGRMIIEIVLSTYGGPCYFTDLQELPHEAIGGIHHSSEWKRAIEIGNMHKSNSFIFLAAPIGIANPNFGKGFGYPTNQYHIIWVDDSLQHITWGPKPQFEGMSTGLCALQIALETGYDEIDLIGFSGLKDGNYKNIYDGTENYSFDPYAPDKVRVPETYKPLGVAQWESIYTELVKKYPNTKVNLI